jgi:hypothetical protein
LTRRPVLRCDDIGAEDTDQFFVQGVSNMMDAVRLASMQIAFAGDENRLEGGIG